MSSFLAALEKASKAASRRSYKYFTAYVFEEDREALLKGAAQLYYEWNWLEKLWPHLAPPNERSIEETRAMHGATVLGESRGLAETLFSAAHDDADVTAFVDVFGDGDEAIVAALADIVTANVYESPEGSPTAAGRRLFLASDQQLCSVGEVLPETNIVDFFLKHIPDRIDAIYRPFVTRLFVKTSELSPLACRRLLAHDASRFTPGIRAAIEEHSEGTSELLDTLLVMHEFGQASDAEVRSQCFDALQDDWGYAMVHRQRALNWILDHLDESSHQPLLQFASRGRCSKELLHQIATRFGSEATDILTAATEHRDQATVIAALELLAAQGDTHREIIAARINKGLGAKDAKEVVALIAFIRRWDPGCMREELWQLIKHKSKPVREATARTLAQLGESEFEPAVALLEEKRAASRRAAVILLSKIDDERCLETLERALETEKDESVRDELLNALSESWTAAGRVFTRDDIQNSITRIADNLDSPIREWIDESRLAPLNYADDQQPLTAIEVRYLLYRQSRCKEISPDIEVKPLYEMLAPSSGHQFADTLFAQFRCSAMESTDRWVLAVVGMLGGDSIVNQLLKQVRDWAGAGRGKMGEYAARSLALIGTDTALCAVHTLAIRHRSKQKNIGAAAEAAFAEAADRLGVTTDELGDTAVPWLGFDEGPRLIQHGERRLEAKIGIDFKLTFRDLEKNKKLSNLPANFPKEIKDEFKTLKASVREVIKGQLVRIENLMVRQFRWPLERWNGLYLKHPLLIPFATQLVWGLYAEQRLVKTFRALEDLTLTDEDDEEVVLPDADQTIGIVHALELTPEQRQAWMEHLNDYKIQTPFPQIERHVFPFREDHQRLKFCYDYDNKELNAMTFRGRAEKLGWQRGSVVDGGAVTSFRKSFHGAGMDVILEIEDYYIGISFDEEVTLRRFCFVRSNTVEFGNYTYDEPHDPSDPRLIEFDSAPPIVYSETLGDLAKICPPIDESK